MRKIVAASLLALLTGCASAGRPIDQSKVATFQRGSTTVTEVEMALGPPTSDTVLPDGTRILGYGYTHAQARPETFIPFIGGFVGGADGSTQVVSFTFSPDGVLRSGSSTQAQTGVGMGLSAR